jgi:hypothetical protein
MRDEDEPSGQRSLRLILDTRESVITAVNRYAMAMHGLADLNESKLRRNWHVRVMAYWRELARYQHTPNLKGVWTDPIKRLEDSVNDDDQRAVSDGGSSMSLADVGAHQLEKTTQPTTQFDPDLQASVKTTQSTPVVFSEDELLAITAKLDHCASELGFDVTPATPTPEDAKADYSDLSTPVNE